MLRSINPDVWQVGLNLWVWQISDSIKRSSHVFEMWSVGGRYAASIG